MADSWMLHPPLSASSGLVVMSWYRRVLRGKLSSREAEKNRFLIIPDFLWYFYFHINSFLFRKIGCISPIFEYNRNRRCCV